MGVLRQKVKILYIIDSLGFGGAERQLVELIKGLDKSRYEIHVCCLMSTTAGYTDVINELGIRYICFYREFKFDIRPISKISRYIRKNRIDLVHAFMNLGSVVGLVAARIARTPVVCSAIRDAKDKNLKMKMSKKVLALLADIIVSNSRAGFANRFSRMKSHFRVVYNGIDFSRFETYGASNSELKKDMALVAFQYVVGSVAALSEHKDHETLINVIPTILRHYPKTCFVLVGDGSERMKLMQKVRQLGIEENVLFLGFRKDVDQIYHIFDLFILLTNSDIILEGISNATIEAMAVGLPVIASEGGGTAEILSNNVNGILVPPRSPQKTAEAIVRLLGNKKMAERLGHAGKTFVRAKFDLQRYVTEYESIYREIM